MIQIKASTLSSLIDTYAYQVINGMKDINTIHVVLKDRVIKRINELTKEENK